MTLAMPHYLALATLPNAPEHWVEELIERSRACGMWPIEAASRAWALARAGRPVAPTLREIEERGYLGLATHIASLSKDAASR